ncbi:ring-opening amidohydrolase [Brachybacterium hainanense]|uniref:Ring-opening amidohydrolase n=1 Tax=Brachybacterium hainanense TaxID=1541174 RepID=A0ABV6R918_9MICO
MIEDSHEPTRAAIAVEAHRITPERPGDMSGLRTLIAEGRLRPDDVVAVTGKIEGDFPGQGRGPSTEQAVRDALAVEGGRTLAQIARIPMAFTASGIGMLSPHAVLWTRRPAAPAAPGETRLALGLARSPVLQPAWIGTSRQIEATAEAVRAAAADGGMDPAEVEYVVAKAFYPTEDDLAAARDAGHEIPELSPGRMFELGSGSAGLGVAVALDGLPMPRGEDVGVRRDLFSSKVAASANPWPLHVQEGPRTRVLAFGNIPGAGGKLRVGHAEIRDHLDVDALRRALVRAGLDVGGAPLTPAQRERVLAVYVKYGLSTDGRLRGRRQVTENPAHVNELKAALAGMYAGYLQDTLLWISASAVHQGPPGGGTIAAIVDVS